MPLRYVPALIIMMGLLFGAFYFYQKETAYVSAMELANGIVVTHANVSGINTNMNGKEASESIQAIVRFTVEGRQYKVKSRATGIPKWKVGREVEVYYDPSNPKDSRIKRIDEVYFYTLMCFFFLSGGILFSTFNYMVYKVTGKPLS